MKLLKINDADKNKGIHELKSQPVCVMEHWRPTYFGNLKLNKEKPL